MSIKVIDDNKITLIGNAIRTKAGTSALIDIDDMPQAIANIPSGGGGDKITSRISSDQYNTGKLDYSIAASDFYENNGAYMKSNAFQGDKNLVSVEIPSSITTLPHGCFTDCTNLNSVTIRGVLGQINDNLAGAQGTFRNCTSLESLFLPIGANCTVYSDAFYGCLSLQSVTFSSSSGICNLTITSEAFSNCTSLTNVTFSNVNLTLSGSTFSYCSAMEECDLGSNVQSIGGSYGHPFVGCSKMKKLIIRNASTVPTLGNGALFTYIAGGVPTNFEGIYVSDALVDTYKSTTNWSLFSSYIKPISELV